ncbi:MAG: hypothetical protein PG981_001420 [Wolbachia endosymbiont of Ctenocephalides orientis wCori]|nr:MAG: hypothetical protein PG981_001420 [Wolbachia endosymbiont of Ctenocephalides orientis wCori]
MLVELVSRNRDLSIQTIKDTEAGLYFGQNAIEIGLADGITTFSEFINQNRRNYIMNEQDKTLAIEQSVDLIEQGKRIGYEKCCSEVLKVISLCNLSKMPEKITEFIEQKASVEQVRESLMSIMLERTMKAEILSTLPQDPLESLVMKEAKARQSA